MPRADHFAKSAGRARMATAALTAELPPSAFSPQGSDRTISDACGADIPRVMSIWTADDIGIGEARRVEVRQMDWSQPAKA